MFDNPPPVPAGSGADSTPGLLLRERKRLDEMSLLIERGQMRPVVDEVLPLGEVGKAHERLDSGHGRGKISLRVAEE